MAIRFGADIVNVLMLGTTPVEKAFLGTLQIWSKEIVSVLGNQTDVVFKSLFPGSWGNERLRKRVVVPANAHAGATQAAYAIAATISADGQAGSWAGELILDIYGTVSGIGGAPNSGKGGDVIWGNFPGRDGQKMIVNLHPGGKIQAGGGGGGRGGNGGPGNYASPYTHHEGPTYNGTTYWGIWPDPATIIVWAGTTLHNGPSSPSVVSAGGWDYYKAQFALWSGEGQIFYIRREQTRYNYPATSGGVAGNAGRGAGYDGAAATGAAPVAGGLNAGASGKSGDGGPPGQPGQAGANGQAGNVGAGTAGAAPGLAGFYINGLANIQFNNLGGTVLGRVA